MSRSDIEGVGNLKVASLLGLIVQTMIWVGFAIFFLIYSALVNNSTVLGAGTPATIPGWITPNTLYIAVGMLAGGFVIGIISYIFFFLGFRAVKRGAPDFGAPTTLVMIGLFGFIMDALGLIIIVGTIVSAINNATSGALNQGNASLDISAIFGGIALIGLGSILALVGVIGLILGNWRAGARYGQSTLKIGAILTIIPYVSLVGYILLLVGYVQAGKKLQSGWIPMGMGAAPMMAPGYGMPPAAPGAPAAGPAPTCPKCGQPAQWVAQYSRWYCHTDQQYPLRRLGPLRGRPSLGGQPLSLAGSKIPGRRISGARTLSRWGCTGRRGVGPVQGAVWGRAGGRRSGTGPWARPRGLGSRSRRAGGPRTGLLPTRARSPRAGSRRR